MFILKIFNAYLTDHIEIEARIGQCTQNGFLPGVSKHAFENIKRVMDTSSKWERKEYYCNYRNHHDETYCTKKSHNDFNSVYSETKCEIVQENLTSFTRNKKRWSYWRYDLTIVSTNDKDIFESNDVRKV